MKTTEEKDELNLITLAQHTTPPNSKKVKN